MCLIVFVFLFFVCFCSALFNRCFVSRPSTSGLLYVCLAAHCSQESVIFLSQHFIETMGRAPDENKSFGLHNNWHFKFEICVLMLTDLHVYLSFGSDTSQFPMHPCLTRVNIFRYCFSILTYKLFKRVGLKHLYYSQDNMYNSSICNSMYDLTLYVQFQIEY